MRRPTSPSLAAFVLLSVLSPVRPVLAADAPSDAGTRALLDSPAFGASPRALLDAARAAGGPEDEDAVVLLDEEVYRYADDGAGRSLQRMVVALRSAEGVQAFSSVACHYRPWREDRPVVRARVVLPDGTERALDAATIAEQALASNDEEYFGETRVLRAPLPAVVPGAVIERACEHSDRRPAIDGMSYSGWYPHHDLRTEHGRLILDLPEALPLRTLVTRLPTLHATHDKSGGRRREQFTLDRFEPTGLPPLLPPPQTSSASVAWSVVPSWAEVSRHYQRIVEGRLSDGGAELKPLADKAVAGIEARPERVAALLALVRRQIRYVAINLGDGGVVPRSPRETLARGFGDCKDKATLLVGLLRTVGIEARVALLFAGTGRDLDAELPDLAQFNHAIVALTPEAPNQPPIFFDPTDDYTRVGELPLSDQGRLVLLAGGDGTLLRTPLDSEREHSHVEVREVLLGEDGSLRVNEVSTMRGWTERGLREDLARPDTRRMRDHLAGYLRGEYDGAELDRFRSGEPHDLRGPLVLRLEGHRDGSPSDAAERTEVTLDIPQQRLFADRVPEPLLRSAEPKRAASKDPDPLPAERTEPVYFAALSTVEWRYRVAPPAGFSPARLPPNQRVELGPARFTRELSADADGVVSATFRFDTGGKHVLAVGEARALRDGLARLMAEPTVTLRFVQRGQEALAAGRVVEALSEFRRLAALHPREALHHDQQARALMVVGLGEAAREEARRGVALEPSSSVAQLELAWTLERDLLGREYQPGFDSAGVDAALRRARELAPKDAGVRVELANHYLRSPDGVLYQKGARLLEALAEFRALAELDDRYAAYPIFPLFALGRYDEVKRLAQSKVVPAEANAMIVAAVALLDGAAAASAEAAQLERDAGVRNQQTRQAYRQLVGARRYPEALAFAERLAEEGGETRGEWLHSARMLRPVRRLDGTPSPRTDATWPIRELFRWVAGGEASKVPAAIFHAHSASPMTRFARETGVGLRFTIRQAVPELSPDGLSEIFQANLEFSAVGDAAVGYRVRVTTSTLNGMGNFFVTSSDDHGLDGLRVLGTTSLVTPLARRALDLARRGRPGDLDAARRWLDWAREERTECSRQDPSIENPLCRLWPGGGSRDRSDIELAAASLLSESPDTAAESVAILEPARPNLDAARRLPADLALANALGRIAQPARMLEVLDRAAESAPDSLSIFRGRVHALLQLDRLDAIDALAADRERRQREDGEALQARITTAIGRRQYREARLLLGGAMSSGRASPSDLNRSAWLSLFLDSPDPGAIDLARRGVEGSPGAAGVAVLHTLAVVQADAGQLVDAYQSLLSLRQRRFDEPHEADELIRARIAEQVGLPALAATLYRRLARPPRSAVESESAEAYAALRLQRMKVRQ